MTTSVAPIERDSGYKLPRRRAWLRRVPVRVVISAILLAVIVGLCISASVVAPYDPNAMHLIDRLNPPVFAPDGTAEFLLGTDATGRDIVTRVLWGGQISLRVGVVTAAIGAVLGTLLGVLCGYFRSWVDTLIMFLVDVQLSLPFLLLAIAVALVFGTNLNVLIGIATLATWPSYTRIIRGVVLSLREREFVIAARSLGARDGYIMRRHILPSLTTPILVLATLNVGQLILLESALSFLGIGIPPTTPSWGNMIGEGREYLSTAWWISVMPGIALLLVTMSIGTIGDWLRDVFDVQG